MTHRTKAESELEAIYAEIPQIPDCDGRCAPACGPIMMFEGEYQRVKRSFGKAPKMARDELTCPMLSPTGRCMVYSVRPLICRLWGATPKLACPHGCQPERWLSDSEAKDLHDRLAVIVGPRVTSPLGSIENLRYALDRAYSVEAVRNHQARTQ